MLNKNLNYTPNSLLHKIDFLNKYNLHTPFTVPKIEKIKFTVLGRLHKKEDIYFKTTFFLYIITQIFPQIKYLQTSKIYLNKEQGFFILTINTLSIREIEFFAYIFFFDILKKDNKTIKKNTLKRTYCTINVPFSTFFEINTLNKILLDSNDSVNIRFTFSSFSREYSYTSLPCFWLI